MKFRSEIYPKLKVRLSSGSYATFVDGELETSDKDTIAALKNLPADRGVKAVGGRVAKGEAKAEPSDKGDEK